MTVPMENIVGAASSDQMVGGHRGLGMLNNVLNDPWRKLGRGGTSAKEQAKLMQYQSQLNREELAHRANINHGELIEQTKAGGFIDEAMKRTEYGYDSQGRPYRGRPSEQTGGSGADTPEEQAAMGVQTSYFPAGGASAKMRTAAGGGLEIGGWQMPSRQFSGDPVKDKPGDSSPEPVKDKPGDSSPEETDNGPEETDTPGGGDTPKSGDSVTTFIPLQHDLRGRSVDRDPETGKLTPVPGRAELKDQNERTAASAKERRVAELEQIKAHHLKQTGVEMPQQAQDEFLNNPPRPFMAPTEMSREYDQRRQAGEPGFDRPSPLETIEGAGGPTPTRGGGTTQISPPSSPAGGGEGVGSALLEGGVKGIAAGVGGALGGPVGAAIAGGIAQAGLNAVKGHRPKRPVQGAPISKSTSDTSTAATPAKGKGTAGGNELNEVTGPQGAGHDPGAEFRTPEQQAKVDSRPKGPAF